MTVDDARVAGGEQPPAAAGRLDLAGSSASALSSVRRWLTEHLAGVTADVMSDAILIADELTSNAYVHGGGPREIVVTRGPETVRIAVTDANHLPLTVGQSRLAHTADRGRGLVIVEKLAKTWGVNHSQDGKTVWAELSLTPRG